MEIPNITIRLTPGRKLPWGAFWRGGTPRKKQAKFFATEREAIAFRDDMMAELARQPDPAPLPARSTPGSVAAYLRTWLKDVVKPRRDGSTYRSYEYLARLHIVPTLVDGTPFGDRTLADLRVTDVRKLYEALRVNGKAYATRKHVHSCLSSALGQATLDDLMARNPCLKVGRTIRHKDETTDDPQPHPMTREQAAAFLSYVAEHAPEWTEYFQFLHDTGVRVGEIAALTWAHVDLDGERAEIVASYSPAEGKDKDPKTHQRRWINLSALVVEQLRELRKRQRKEWLARGRQRPIEYVFTNRAGSPRRQDGNMRRVFDRVIEHATIGTGDDARLAFGVTDKRGRVTIERFTPHDIRDTFATTHLSTDYSRLPWVSRQLGHETERTTLDHYFRFLPSTATKQFANLIR